MELELSSATSPFAQKKKKWVCYRKVVLKILYPLTPLEGYLLVAVTESVFKERLCWL